VFPGDVIRIKDEKPGACWRYCEITDRVIALQPGDFVVVSAVTAVGSANPAMVWYWLDPAKRANFPHMKYLTDTGGHAGLQQTLTAQASYALVVRKPRVPVKTECTCEMATLMREGCTCGAIQRYAPPNLIV